MNLANGFPNFGKKTATQARIFPIWAKNLNFFYWFWRPILGFYLGSSMWACQGPIEVRLAPQSWPHPYLASHLYHMHNANMDRFTDSLCGEVPLCYSALLIQSFCELISPQWVAASRHRPWVLMRSDLLACSYYALMNDINRLWLQAPLPPLALSSYLFPPLYSWGFWNYGYKIWTCLTLLRIIGTASQTTPSYST